MSKLITGLLIIFVCKSCNHKRVSNGSEVTSGFDTVSLHNVDSINEAWAEFVGKFGDGDTIQFVNLDTVDYDGVFVDTDLSELDAISNATDSFKVIAYFDQKIPSNIRSDSLWYYPVYVVNVSRGDRYFVLKDDYVFAIQEAIYPDGKWYPIEKRPTDDCLNGRWSVKVKPGEFLVFLMNKYQGDFKTKIRVRLRIGRSIYYSQPIDGYINLEQFLVKRENFKAAFLSDSAFIKDFLFYGATPLQALK